VCARVCVSLSQPSAQLDCLQKNDSMKREMREALPKGKEVQHAEDVYGEIDEREINVYMRRKDR